MARRKTQLLMMSAGRLRDQRLAPSGAPASAQVTKAMARLRSALTPAPKRMLIWQRLVGHRAPLSVLGRAEGPLPKRSRALQAGRRPVAQTHTSASSWQGLVMDPGGAPAPPECLARDARPAGRRTPSRNTTPHDAPFKGRGGVSVR